MARSNVIKVPQCVFQTNRLEPSTIAYKLTAFETNVALGARPSKEDWLYVFALHRQWNKKFETSLG